MSELWVLACLTLGDKRYQLEASTSRSEKLTPLAQSTDTGERGYIKEGGMEFDGQDEGFVVETKVAVVEGESKVSCCRPRNTRGHDE